MGPKNSVIIESHVSFAVPPTRPIRDQKFACRCDWAAMSASWMHNRSENAFKFSTPEGETLCRQILTELLPFEPHNVQIEGVCKILDGINVFAILPTRMGKTSFLYMYILVIQAIKRSPSFCPTVKFPTNSCLLAICPTKYLQHQMVRNIHWE